MKYFLKFAVHTYFILIFTSCSTFSRIPGIYTDIETFRPYITEYINLKQIYLGTDKAYYAIDIIYGTPEFPTVGQCYRTSDPDLSRQVIINAHFWANSNDNERLELLLHELGHCDLNFSHQEERVGIMNAKLKNKELTDTVIKDFFLEGI